MDAKQNVGELVGTVTQGPWRADGTEVNAWHQAGKQVVAECFIEYPAAPGAQDPLPGCNQMKHDAAANAARIVACVNALQGVTDPAGYVTAMAELMGAAERARVILVGATHPTCRKAGDGIEALTAALARCREVQP